MTFNSATSLIARVAQIARDADEFRKGVEIYGTPGLARWHCEVESAYGKAAKSLADDLRWIKTVEQELPPQTRFGFSSLHDLFFSLVERWRWHRVIDSNGYAYLLAQDKVKQERKRSYLSAARSYVEACLTKRINERPERWHFELTEEAERDGIPPSVPVADSAEAVKSLHETWLLSPCLGPDFPLIQPEEGTAWKSATFDIEEGIQGNRSEHVGSDESSTDANPSESAPSMPDIIPSMTELSELLQATQRFSNQNRYTMNWTWVQEDDTLPRFRSVADALRPIRPHLGSMDQWPPIVEHAVCAIASIFDAITITWGWERVADSDPSIYLAERRAWFHENIARPRYEAALAWQARDGVRCPYDISVVANEGWNFGFKPTVSAEDVVAKYTEADKRWVDTPRFGTRYPKIEDEMEKGFVAPFQQLSAVVNMITQRAVTSDKSHPSSTLEPDQQNKSSVDLSQHNAIEARDGAKTGTPSVEIAKKVSPRGRLKEPPQKAMDAYRAVKLLGMKQEAIAPQFGVGQGTISRWVKQVKKWIEAGNILPDLDAPRSKPVSMDPRKLEQGPRRARTHKSDEMRDASN